MLDQKRYNTPIGRRSKRLHPEIYANLHKILEGPESTILFVTFGNVRLEHLYEGTPHRPLKRYHVYTEPEPRCTRIVRVSDFVMSEGAWQSV